MKRLFQHNIHGRVLSVLLTVTVGSGTLVMAPYVAAGTGGAADANAAAIPIAADGALDNLTEITPEEASRYLSGNNAAQAAPKVTIESFASDTKTIPVGEAKSVVFTAKATKLPATEPIRCGSACRPIKSKPSAITRLRRALSARPSA